MSLRMLIVGVWLTMICNAAIAMANAPSPLGGGSQQSNAEHNAWLKERFSE